MFNSIRGLTAFVTGGGSGLGYAVCQRLAREGARVVTMDLRPSEVEIENVTALAGDIRNEEDINSALKLCTDAQGKPKLNVLVNCAGVANAFKIYNFTTQTPQRLKDLQDLVDINVIGTFSVIRAAAPLLGDNPPNESGVRGSIINTSSVLAYDGHEGQAGFASTQMAINSMTLPLAREFAEDGIRVNTIATGFFETPLVTRSNAPELFEFIDCATPCPPRMGKPEEFAQLVQTIIENNMINGSVYRIDGALRWPERG